MAEEEAGEYFNPEEEVKIDQKCTLEKVEIKTGLEDEELIYKGRAVLYRMREKEWKERGRGDVKLLRNKNDKKIRLILRQDQTLKIVANFIVSHQDPMCILKPFQESDKIFMFSAMDFSDEENGKTEIFNIKLGKAEKAKEFKEAFEAARVFNKLLAEGKESELKYAPVIKDENEMKVNKEADKKDEKKEDKKDEKKEEEKKE